MQPVLFDKIGEPREVLELKAIPPPSPGPREVLVRMLLVPVHPSDLHMVRGRYGYQPPLPASPGAEGVGVVEAVGPGVSEPTVGARVVFIDCWNLWRELVVCKADRLVVAPDGISDEAAAVSFTVLITAWGLTIIEHELKQGDWLLQTAANSSVRKLVLQLAKLHGFRTINVIRRRNQEGEIRALSGDVVICTEDEDLRGRLAEVTGGTGVLKAIDSVAGEVGAEVVRSLAPGGTMLQYGALSTHRQTDPQKLVMPVFSPKLIYSMASIRGWWLTHWIAGQGIARVRDVVKQILSLVAAGQLVPPATTVHSPTELDEVLQVAERAGQRGKALLRFSSRLSNRRARSDVKSSSISDNAATGCLGKSE